ncbi:MAG: winged helix-turn-helix transcriptional regulator [Candidatus Omnitrophica bacterium]|nr:winged helix-turn-helix transcriptional regulator [Candidatus Omnitrophota bacterium]
MQELEQILKVLADKNRMRIIKLLEQRPMCVCELAYVLGIKQPSVSRHLKKMKACGVIREEQNSYWKDYSLAMNKGGYTRSLTRNFKTWLNEDPVVKQDRARLRKADRNTLCCR